MARARAERAPLQASPALKRIGSAGAWADSVTAVFLHQGRIEALRGVHSQRTGGTESGRGDTRTHAPSARPMSGRQRQQVSRRRGADSNACAPEQEGRRACGQDSELPRCYLRHLPPALLQCSSLARPASAQTVFFPVCLATRTASPSPLPPAACCARDGRKGAAASASTRASSRSSSTAPSAASHGSCSLRTSMHGRQLGLRSNG